jgi:Na+-translocating ferredoxin:NAD+ oxidoreductase subunit G
VREMLKLGFILMAMSLICAAALGFVNSQTADRIAAQKEIARQEAMTLVSSYFGDSLTFDSLSVPGLANPYEETGRGLAPVEVMSGGTRVGYLFTAYRKGYSSVIETLVSVDISGTIRGSTILYQVETPGLGTKYADPAWLERLEGLDGQGLALAKDGGAVDAVTGATVSGRAIVGSVSDGIEAMRAAGLFDEPAGTGAAGAGGGM